MGTYGKFSISILGGISQIKTKVVQNNINMYEKLNTFHDMINKDWETENQLSLGEDYTSLTSPATVTFNGAECSVFGFGASGGGGTTWNTVSVKGKIKAQLEHWVNEAKNIFKNSEGFSFSDVQDIAISANRNRTDIVCNNINIHSVKLTNEKFPTFEGRILYGANSINSSYFSVDHKILENGITELVSPREAEILQSWDSATNPSATKRSGVTLGISTGYNHTFFPKASSQYGVYCGTEAFAEVNPNPSKSNGFSIKEKEIGIRPFFGIEAKDKWMIYGLCGIKYCRKNIKSETLNCNKSKPGYEIGVGTDYVLSDKFSIGAKFIKTLKSTLKVNDINFQTSSTKILFSLSYTIN